jgi:hypothetical protein
MDKVLCSEISDRTLAKRLQALDLDGQSDLDNGELKELRDSIIKSRQYLSIYLEDYNKLLADKQFIDEQEKQMKTMIRDIKNHGINVLHIANQMDSPPDVSDDVSNHIDGLAYSTESIENAMTQVISAKKTAIDEKMKTTSGKLAYLSEAFSLSRGFNGRNMCPICMTNDVAVAFDPCGHCVCATCVKWNNCYICRARILKVLKLFFV